MGEIAIILGVGEGRSKPRNGSSDEGVICFYNPARSAEATSARPSQATTLGSSSKFDWGATIAPKFRLYFKLLAKFW